MPSTQQLKECAFVPDQMAGSSTLPVSEPRQRHARFSSGTWCLLMTQQLHPTPRRNSSHYRTASHMHVRTSDWPSVWRRRMSWDRTQKHRRSIPSATTNSMLSVSSPTSAPPWWQPPLARRDRQEDWEGSFNSRSSHGSSVEKPQAVCEDKCGGLQWHRAVSLGLVDTRYLSSDWCQRAGYMPTLYKIRGFTPTDSAITLYTHKLWHRRHFLNREVQ